ncbi:unnamed protein product [Rotaria sp. Silwood1]|nr:unnamed protein product [Rotaria sp. Silwood1]
MNTIHYLEIKQSKLNFISPKIKTKVKILKKSTQPFHYNNITSTTGYSCYPSSFPCFRSCGPINCPENKLPMPRDLWYRIVYSQALEQQLGSGEASVRQSRSGFLLIIRSFFLYYEIIIVGTLLQSSSKRKQKEDGSITDKSSYNNLHKNKSNSNNSRQQQTMNAAFSTTSTKIIKLDTSLTLDDHLYKSEFNQDTSPFVPSNSYKLFPMDNLEYVAEILPLQIENKHSHSTSPIRFQQSKISIEQLTNKITKDNSHIDATIMFEHPLMNQLYEHYNLEDIPRFQLFKQLNRRLTHIHETLKTMSSNDIEIKLKYKHDALTKKRQIPIQSLTKDECIAMAELELNVYEYNKALDKSSSKYFPLNNNDQLENEQLSPTLPSLLSYDPIIPVIKNAIISETSISPSISTLHAVFEPMTSSWKAQIHKQLARRYEHICTKAKQLSETQLQAPLEQSKKILQPNKDERLRIAELELCLFELEKGK